MSFFNKKIETVTIEPYFDPFEAYATGGWLTHLFKDYLVGLFDSNNSEAYVIYKEMRKHKDLKIDVNLFQEIETAKDKYFERKNNN